MSDLLPEKERLTTDKNWHPWQMQELPAIPVDKKRSACAPPMPPAAKAAADKLAAAAKVARLQQEAHDEAYKTGHQEGYEAGFAQAREEGFAHGQQEGKQAGLQEMRQQSKTILAALSTLMRNVDEAWQALDDEIANAVLELALSVGRQLAREDLDAHPQQILDIVRELLHKEAVFAGKPRLWLHPEDLILVQEHLQQETSAAGWQLQPDSSMSRSGCRISSASGEIDASWEQRWQSVVDQVRRPRRRKDADNVSSQFPASTALAGKTDA